MKWAIPLLIVWLAGCSSLSDGQKYLAARNVYNATLTGIGIALDSDAMTPEQADEAETAQAIVHNLFERWHEALIGGEDFDYQRVLDELAWLEQIESEVRNAADGTHHDAIGSDTPRVGVDATP